MQSPAPTQLGKHTHLASRFRSPFSLSSQMEGQAIAAVTKMRRAKTCLPLAQPTSQMVAAKNGGGNKWTGG